MSAVIARTARSATASLVLTSAALLTGLMPSAQAQEPASPAVNRADAADAVHLKLDKNSKHPAYSRLSVIKGSKVWANFRAGSGITQNECTTGRGWLPNGTYSVGSHTRTYNGRQIKGYAIRLADKRCNNGTGRLRTELFIHSEMNRNGTQGSSEPRKWTNKNPNDYLSNGCIKMHPDEIKKLFRLLDRIGWPKSLKVVS